MATDKKRNHFKNFIRKEDMEPWFGVLKMLTKVLKMAMLTKITVISQKLLIFGTWHFQGILYESEMVKST